MGWWTLRRNRDDDDRRVAGDFDLVMSSLWLRLWGVVLMLSGIGMISVTVAFIADVLLSRRLPQAANRQLVSHFVATSSWASGRSFRVASLLKDTGHAVTVRRANRGQPLQSPRSSS
jgi:hypothetical protein